jgi:hypothetical protein
MSVTVEVDKKINDTLVLLFNTELKMKKSLFLGLCLVVVVVFANTNSACAQAALTIKTPIESVVEVEEPRISNSELIKLATNTPNPDRYSNEQEYVHAKNKWIKENPDAYGRIIGKSLSEEMIESLKSPE